MTTKHPIEKVLEKPTKDEQSRDKLEDKDKSESKMDNTQNVSGPVPENQNQTQGQGQGQGKGQGERSTSNSGGGIDQIFAPIGDCQDKTKFILFWSLYVAAGILVFICGCICLDYSEAGNKVDWLITTSKMTLDFYFTPHKVCLYFLFIILILLFLGVAVLMCLKGIVVKEMIVYQMAFSEWGKFIVIPMFLTWICELIELIQQGRWEKGKSTSSDEVACKASCMIFALLAAGGYCFIYYKLPKTNKELWTFLYKKCFISACVAYHIFLFMNALSDLIRDDNLRRGKNIHKTLKVLSVIWIIIYSAGMGAITYFFDEICVAGFAAFFNLGFFISSARTTKKRFYMTQRILGNLICGIIFFVAFAALIAYIVITKKMEFMN